VEVRKVVLFPRRVVRGKEKQIATKEGETNKGDGGGWSLEKKNMQKKRRDVIKRAN